MDLVDEDETKAGLVFNSGHQVISSCDVECPTMEERAPNGVAEIRSILRLKT